MAVRPRLQSWKKKTSMCLFQTRKTTVSTSQRNLRHFLKWTFRRHCQRRQPLSTSGRKLWCRLIVQQHCISGSDLCVHQPLPAQPSWSRNRWTNSAHDRQRSYNKMTSIRTNPQTPTTSHPNEEHHQRNNEAPNREIDPLTNKTTNNDPISLPYRTEIEQMISLISMRVPTPPETSPSTITERLIQNI